MQLYQLRLKLVLLDFKTQVMHLTNKFFCVILSISGLVSCSTKVFLVKKNEEGKTANSNAFSYQDHKGKEIVPSGKYFKAFTDTIHTIGFVGNKQGSIIAIDTKGKEIFQVFKNDGQPDYVADGLLRIVKDQKIGYADMMGKIILKPIYKCAFPFYDGKAKVAINCDTETIGEYNYWKSDNWLFIDKSGKIANEK
jgi:hypothetical protein